MTHFAQEQEKVKILLYKLKKWDYENNNINNSKERNTGDYSITFNEDLYDFISVLARSLMTNKWMNQVNKWRCYENKTLVNDDWKYNWS